MKIHKASKRRRAHPIHAYIGPNGGGKSLCAIFDALPDLAAGRHVVSTVRILDAATGEPHPLWIPLDSYRQLLDAEHCRMILDEVTGVASSRESMGMPPAVANRLVQLRRQDVALAWTAPAWARADRMIRECSQAVTLCMGFMPQTSEDEQGERQWSQKRLFYWRTYDATTFDEWTSYRKERARPLARQLFWRPGHDAERSYDTYDSVLSLGAVTESGACMDCGGRRTAHKCECAKTPAYLGRRVATLPTPTRRVAIAETDDTPGVVVEVPTVDPLLGLRSS